MAQQRFGRLHECHHLAWLYLEVLLPSKGQQLLRQRRTTLGAADRAADQPLRLGVLCKMLRQQLEIAQHGHQQVVEVMRDAASEFAQHLHLLRLAEFLFGLLTFDHLGQNQRVRQFQLTGAFGDAQFEGFVQVAQGFLRHTQALFPRWPHWCNLPRSTKLTKDAQCNVQPGNDTFCTIAEKLTSSQ